MKDQYRDLVQKACAARLNSHSPYSNFRVGAALLASDGRIFVGTNVENASFGLSNCAERTAIFTAVTAGATEFEASPYAPTAPSQLLPVEPAGKFWLNSVWTLWCSSQVKMAQMKPCAKPLCASWCPMHL